jgi:PAS domain S-box-containing protein
MELAKSIDHHPPTQLYDHLPVAVYTCDSHGYIASYNKAAVKLWGRTPEVGVDLWCGSSKIYKANGQMLTPGEWPVARAMKEGASFKSENIIIERPDGTTVKVQPYPIVFYSGNGELTGAVNTLIDITAITQVDEKQAVLAAIIDTSDDTIISKTLQGIITSWNKSAERMFGYTDAEIIGKHISILIPQDRLNEEEHIIGQIGKGNKVDHFETLRVSKDGRLIPISLSVSPIKDGSGNIVGASKIARDISIQKAASDAAIRYTQSLETINSTIKTITEELELTAILQKVIDATTRLTGAQFGAFFYNNVDASGESYMLYSLSGGPGLALKKPDLPFNARSFDDTFPEHKAVRSDDVTADPLYQNDHLYYGILSGHLPVVSYLAVPVVSRSGNIIGALFFGHPEAGIFTAEHELIVSAIASQAAISLDNAKLYEQIRAMNEKKDEFIGLASHELKTPLTSISGYLQILNRMQSEEKNRNFVTKAINQVNKLSLLISDLLDVSKIHAGKLQLSQQRFDISKLVTDAVELIGHAYHTHIINLIAPAGELHIVGDPQRIEQVLINLLTNAIKYSPSGDKIVVSLNRTDNKLVLSVQDFGFGIPAGQLKQIFTRFHRVEDHSHTISGLGIGLYICHEIVERHNGRIWAESETGKGSTFWVSLPLND